MVKKKDETIEESVEHSEETTNVQETNSSRWFFWRGWSMPNWQSFLPQFKIPTGSFLQQVDWLRARRVFAPTALALFAASTGLLFYLQPWAPLEKVTINTETSDGPQLLEKMSLTEGVPTWRVKGQTTFWRYHMMNRFETVDNVTIRYDQQTLVLDVVDKVTAGYLPLDKQWYALNRHGRLAQKVNRPADDAPIYQGFKAKDAKIYQDIAQQFAQLEVALRTNVSQIELSPTKSNAKRIVLYMNDGNTVYATYDELGQKMAYYANIAAQMSEKGVVDLQFGAFSYAYGTQKANDEALKKAQQEAKEKQKTEKSEKSSESSEKDN